MSTVQIRCKVLPGLFDTEYYVMVNGSSAYYINKVNVQVESEPRPGHAVDGVVLGYAVEEANNKTLVQLPGEVALGGVRTWVDSADVALAAA